MEKEARTVRLGIRAVLIPAAAILLFAAIGTWKRKEGRKHPWHCTLYCRDAEAWCCLITPALCLCVPLLVLILNGKTAPERRRTDTRRRPDFPKLFSREWPKKCGEKRNEPKAKKFFV